MDKNIIGYFHSEDYAEEAVKQLRSRGFSDNEISILSKEAKGDQKKGEGKRQAVQNLSDGTLTGVGLGGIAGWALSGVALAIPGIGPIVAAGPITALLTGAITGGVAGGLVDYGIPEERSKHYEEKLSEGKILAALKADEEKIDEAASLLREYGAKDVEVH